MVQERHSELSRNQIQSWILQGKVAVDGKKVSSSRELSITVANASVGEQIPITILRDGKEERLQVALVKRVDLDASVQDEAKNSKDLGLQVTVLEPEILPLAIDLQA